MAARKWVKILAVLVVIGIVRLLVRNFWNTESPDNGNQPLFAVKRGPLRINITESGAIQNRDQVVVKNQVEGRTTILWIIAEGAYVQKDDLLVQLDDSSLQDRKIQQEATVLSAEAGYIGARENLAVTESQNKSDIAEAELALELATLDHDKYLKGEYLQEMQQLENQHTIIAEELNRAKQKLEWSQELNKEGYITDTELQADKLALKKSELDLELAERKLEVFKTYTHPRNIRQLESDISQAAEALERVKGRTRADFVQAEADLKAKESEFQRQKTSLQKTTEQIAKCRIEAPVAGMAVYSTTGKGSWRGNVEPLQEGQEVHERQELVYLPTTASMMAEVKIHESSLRKVKPDMPVVITCDALPGRVISGRVGKIGLLPDAQSMWLNPDLKVFNTEIYLDGNGGNLQPGMTCQAEIIVAEYTDALYVPIQCVLRVAGKPTVYLPGPKDPEPRQVRLGLDNNRMVHILEGLQEGQEVLLAPPMSASAIVTESPDPGEAAAGGLEGGTSSEPATEETKDGSARPSSERPSRPGGNSRPPRPGSQTQGSEARTEG